MAYYQTQPGFEGYLADIYEDDPVFAEIARNVAESQSRFNGNEPVEDQYGRLLRDELPPIDVCL